jgi:hypothetical protein
MVQAAGRVNRHRLHPVERRNVAILQFNWRAVTGDDARPVFVRPGLEAPGTHPSHDLAELIDWQALSVLDARLRFGDHPFAHYDDQALREALSLPMRRQFSAGRLGHLWMGQETYTSTPLRAQEGEEVELCPDPGRAGTYLAMFEGAAGKSTGRSLGGETRRHARDWLVLDDAEALALAHEMSVDPADALRVSLRLYPTAHEERYDLSRVRRDLSFGFWKSRSSDQP